METNLIYLDCITSWQVFRLLKLKLGFIPFECVERTKKYYKIFKNNIKQKLKDEYENNKIVKEMVCTFSFLPIFGLGLYFAFKNTKGEN